MLFIGIDPGKSGAIAFLHPDGTVARVDKMPPTEVEILELLGGTGVKLVPAVAVLEFVRTMPKQGIVSAFTFGMGYGGLRMALAATMTPYDEVRPQVWQKAMQCRSGGDKNVTKRRAAELFPGLKITHVTADSLLLAAYCRRRHLGLL